MSIIAHRRGLLPEQLDTGWTPAELGGSLLVWMDARSPDTLVESDGRLVEWQSRNAPYVYHQPLLARQPTVELDSLNGHPGVRFNGFSNSMFTTSNLPLTGNPSFTVYALYRKRAVAQGTVHGWGSIQVALGSMVLFDNNTLVSYTYAGNNNYRINPVPVNTPMIQGYSKTPGSIRTTSIAHANGSPTDAGGHSTQTPNIQAGPAWLGGFQNLTEFYLNGTIYEYLIVQGALTSRLERTVEGYLAHRWGTEFLLPTNHLFRFVAP